MKYPYFILLLYVHSVATTVEPRLSEPRGRHTIGSDKREVRIDGVASETDIGGVYGVR